MAIANIRAVVLDCPDPRGLADFYRALIGGDIVQEEPVWVRLRDGKQVALAFQKVDDYRPPRWPSAERPQQFHIDVTVDDVDRAEQEVLALGATKHDVQPGTRAPAAFECSWILLGIPSASAGTERQGSDSLLAAAP